MNVSKKDNLKIAKKFFRESFADRELDLMKVRANVKTIKLTYQRSALGILKFYLNLLKIYLAKETLKIEAVDKLHPRYIDEIKVYFEQLFGKGLKVSESLNSSLLGSLRISLGDTQWDYSTKSKIENVKEILDGRSS
jgi:F0F1-type ATP synthase delta subunit